MALVNFPYRLTRRTWRKNLAHAYDDLRAGARNLIRWAPVVWADRWFDGEFLLVVIELKLRTMADRFETHGVTANRGRDVRRMRVCAEVCRRLAADDYANQPDYFTGETMTTRRLLEQPSVEMEYLGKMLGKHLLTWWD